jgi:sulfate adenylyltransferase large subunit
VLLDARKGVIEQTRRHAAIVRLLGVPHVVFAVNKMDLVDYDESAFEAIASDLEKLAAHLGLRDTRVIPVAALHGDNVVDRSDRLAWWTEGTLLELLEVIEIADDRDATHRRFPVQWVIRPMSDEHHDYRGYAGQVAGGEWRAGDDVVVLPSGLRTRVASVDAFDGPLDVAVQGMSVVLRLEDDLDVPRGEMLVAPDDQPVAARELTATICWMSERPSSAGARFGVKHTTRWSRAILDEVISRLDVDTLEQVSAETLALNDIATVRLRLASPLLVDPYEVNRTTGSFILVDEATNDTLAAGMVVSAE